MIFKSLLDYMLITDTSGAVTLVFCRDGKVAFDLPIEIPGDTERAREERATWAKYNAAPLGKMMSR